MLYFFMEEDIMNSNWEYKILKFFSPVIAKRDGNLSTSDMEQILNENGEQGWEMTGIIYSANTDSMNVFLKRQKEN